MTPSYYRPWDPAASAVRDPVDNMCLGLHPAQALSEKDRGSSKLLPSTPYELYSSLSASHGWNFQVVGRHGALRRMVRSQGWSTTLG